MSGELPDGLYERLVDRRLLDLLGNLPQGAAELRHVDPADAPAVLAQYLERALRGALAGLKGGGAAAQVAVCNELLLRLLSGREAVDAADAGLPPGEPSQLLSVFRSLAGGLGGKAPRPETPLAQSAILTGGRVDPSLVSQLRHEIRFADGVDILCSFIKWSGIRVLEDDLKAFCERGGQLRVITTSYTGATDLKAVQRLASLPGAQVRVSLDTSRTRLHAKAYLFHRDTGFGSAYVGSANISNAALTDGLEWCVKISQYQSPDLWEKTARTFDVYWADPEFERCASPEELDRLGRALQSERSSGGAAADPFPFDVRPYGFQQEILDRLQAERELHGRFRNLVVAATGTGKTVVAAFDYARFCRQSPGLRPPMLFVAHRQEILTQSLATFRGVLRDWNFGDLLVGGRRPEQREHLFISIQSCESTGLPFHAPAPFYRYVVIDEFHHAAAPTYRRLLDRVQPEILLGLTATPERADGQDIISRFDGHIAAELRLPDAINRKLLCPFQYFGITDTVDLTALGWRRGYIPTELDNVYTGDAMRAELIVRQVCERLLDPRKARGLGFCVSVRHAEFMARFFAERGIPSDALSASTPDAERQLAKQRLARGDINFLFVVDLYNEGVDIPDVDTVLFLRPTESLTVFLQQLGRGLRLAEGKDCLTVLDFIGAANRQYDFESRFRALMDRPRHRVAEEIEAGFAHVPLGCSVQLERVAQQHVLENIRQALHRRRDYIIQKVREYCEASQVSGEAVGLAGFLGFSGMEPDQLYSRVSWSRALSLAGQGHHLSWPDEQTLTKGLRKLARWDGPRQIPLLIELLSAWQSGALDVAAVRAEEERTLAMMLQTLGLNGQPVGEALMQLGRNGGVIAEIAELLAYRFDTAAQVSPELSLPFVCPMDLYASYTRDEVLVGMGHWTLARQPSMREGVLYLPAIRAEVLFVTLNKSERDYSPTTLYEDYAVSDSLFHWQSQSTTSAESATGQRYVHHQEQGATVLLFVREEKETGGLANPYAFLGPVIYRSHSGSKPMSVLWELQHRLPARLLPTVKRLSAA